MHKGDSASSSLSEVIELTITNGFKVRYHRKLPQNNSLVNRFVSHKLEPWLHYKCYPFLGLTRV